MSKEMIRNLIEEAELCSRTEFHISDNMLRWAET